MSDCIEGIIRILFMIFVSYQGIFILVSLFGKEKEEETDIVFHRYAIMICARNEEAVIADLLESLRRQAYPKECFDVFVMADNCVDDTAVVAGSCGAIVYQRCDTEKVGKGYALKVLLQEIRKDHGDSYDAYLILDADNILENDYLEQMNLSYCKGHRIICSYINSKNFSSNWISAGYSIFLLKKDRFLNRARHLLGLSCAANGTGFLFADEIIDEWEYHTLTEDIEFSVDQVCRKRKIAFCEKAILYDEQPVSFLQSFHQRLRWAKGYVQVFGKYGHDLLNGVCRASFSCFDMLNTLVSAYALSLFSVFYYVITFLYLSASGRNVDGLILDLLKNLLQAYAGLCLTAGLTVVCEWKKIRASSFDKVRYIFTFPLFMATYVPIAFLALFRKVEWVPIRHSIRSEKNYRQSRSAYIIDKGIS